MPYSTRADLEVLVSENTLRQLTDDSQSGDVNDQAITEVILLADDTIDGYLRGRYTVPLQTVPPVIMGLSRDLALYELWSKKGEGGVPEEARLRKKDAMAKLADIAAGILVLNVTSPDAKTAGHILTNKTAEDRKFGKAFWSRF